MGMVRMWCGVVVALLMLVGATPLAAQQWTWPEEGENLTSLTAQQLRFVMPGFTRALGVRCSYCHVGEEGQPLSAYDFASDEKLAKQTARTMLGMLGDINQTLQTVESSGDRVNMWCHTCHRGRPRPLTLEEELTERFKSEGGEAALTYYDELRDRFYGRGAYDFGENQLNNLGYGLMGQGAIDMAIMVFEKNVEVFPESSNVFDSLGEGYMERGDTDLAIENYERSLELDPQNENAVTKLEELRAGG